MTSDRYHNEYLDNAVCFWTSSIIDHIPVFRSRTACLALLDTWDHYRRHYGTKIIGYVIMPDHSHLAFWSAEAERAKRFVEQSLRRSSSAIVAMTVRAAERGVDPTEEWLRVYRSHARGRAKARVWKERGHGFPVTDADTLREKLEYMHNNPVKLDLVKTPEEWEFSSAAWYLDGSGPLAMDEFDWL